MKRLLALCLLLVLLCTLASGASAAGFADRFTDWDQIRHQAQVAMLADLQVISGYTDGSFRPVNSITRAETAKIITYLKTAAMPASAGSRFRDTVGNWAADYIEYCAGAGILSGDGNGIFRPKDNVTARELAKMLLVTIGHSAGRYTGAGWADAVDQDAEAEGLYDGYTRERSLYISRDDACRMISNALACSVIVGYDGDVPQYELDEMMTPKTLLEHRFGVKLVTGVLQANAQVDLRDGQPLADGMIHINGYTRDFYVTDRSICYDNSLLGRRVTVYASFGSSYNVVYGMPGVRASEGYATFREVAELLTVLDYGALKTDAQTEYYENFAAADETCLSADAQSATIIDHENDGVIDIVLVTREGA